MTFLTRLGNWLKDHVDLALILAAATEIPRWTVAFLAIHEPLWVGVPLGALLAWALKDGWNGYFRTKRLGILALNLAALATAICVITPVLYVMTYVPVEQVNLTMVFGDSMAWRMGWAGLLALSTFLPLIQLSAVRPASVPKAHDTPDILPLAANSDIVADLPKPESDKPVVIPQPAPTPASVTDDTAALEEMLEDVDMTGGQVTDMAAAWQNAFVAFGKIGVADEVVSSKFGISKRTVIRKRTAGKWEAAGTLHKNGNGWDVKA